MNIFLTLLVIFLLIFTVYIICYYYYRNKYIDIKSPATILEKNKSILSILKWNAETIPYSNYCALNLKKNNSKEWKSINYKEYYNNVKQFAECLYNNNIEKNSKIAILGFNSQEWYYAHLGTMLLGGCSVGLYPTSDKKTCEYIINQTNTSVIVIDDSKQLKKLIDIKIPSVKLIIYYGNCSQNIIEKVNPSIKVLNYLQLINTKIEKKIEFNLPNLDKTATIIYTSGTTGNPKGVVITHNNITSILKNMTININYNSNIQFNVGEKIISYLPLNHIAAQIMDIYLPICIVGEIYFAQPDALKGSLINTLKEVKPTIFIGVPRVWEKMMEKLNSKFIVPPEYLKLINNIIKGAIGLNNCKYAITAAAPLDDYTKKFFKKLDIDIYDVYGMSETAGPISLSYPGNEKLGSVGKPIIDIKISKENEILVKGESVFKKYYKNSSETEKVFENNWLKTGDMGKLDNDGFLFITGRLKDIIITAGGENVSPIPIEDKLKHYLSIYFDYIIIIGDKRKFLSVLLVPKYKFESSDNLIKDFDNMELINEHIKNSLEKVNNTAPSNACKIQKWEILKNKFNIGDELTPTLKIKRRNIQDKYKEVIDKLYK